MLLTGIGVLATNDPQLGPGLLGEIHDAAVAVEAGWVVWVGREADAPQGVDGERIDVAGRCVVPGFVDAHTHLVFAGDRATEFEARMAGTPYQAGGIRTTVSATRAATTAQLAQGASRLAAEALRGGTTTLETKSGYGLTVVDERRSLEAAATVAGDDVPAVERTFLGAHVVPAEHTIDDYVALVCGEMMQACAPLAAWCDVFCEDGAFGEDEARAVLRAGAAHGLGARIHANQLGHGPGAQLAAEVGAASADHLTFLSDADVAALVDGGVVATLLPAAEFCTRSAPAPARRLLSAGVVVALASDCNPGTSYTTSMPFVVALACQRYGLTAAEAVHAATAGGAAALRRADVGHLAVGAAADLVVIDAPTPVHLAYRPGVQLVATVVRGGRVAWRSAA